MRPVEEIERDIERERERLLELTRPPAQALNAASPRADHRKRLVFAVVAVAVLAGAAGYVAIHARRRANRHTRRGFRVVIARD